jgi:glycerol 2-dehydrogenase (NADP+)
MEKLVGTGKVKAIGVCNYSVKYLEELLLHATVTPAVNRIESHPYLPQPELVSFCNTRGIHIMAYSPLGSAGSPLLKESLVETIAAKHGISSATVLLSYHSLSHPATVLIPDYMLTLGLTDKRGSTVIAKSVQVSRIDQNSKMIDLDAEDMEALEIIYKSAGIRRYVYPAFHVDFGFPDKS